MLSEQNHVACQQMQKQQQDVDQQLEARAEHICQTKAKNKLWCVVEDSQGKIKSRQSPQVVCRGAVGGPVHCPFSAGSSICLDESTTTEYTKDNLDI